jgi:ubiquinol-cytochrome c reductase iron-sulfur subunit
VTDLERSVDERQSQAAPVEIATGAPQGDGGQRPEALAAGPSPTAGTTPYVWPSAVGLLAAIGGGVGFAWAYIVDAGNAWLGGFLALALLGLGFALAYWGRDLAGDEEASGRYPVPYDDVEAQVALAAGVDGAAQVVTRRGFLTKLLVVGAAVFGLSQVVLIASLGPRPRKSYYEGAWLAGTRLVTFDGQPVTREALADGGFIVAFPQGHTDSANSQVVLLRLPPDRIKPQPGRESWSPEGFVAYSRVCTHAGCPVAQYEDERQILLCPCHQSQFDVFDGARPVGGPAARALPQLPLAIDGAGYLVAQSDFTEPVGPGSWTIL